MKKNLATLIFLLSFTLVDTLAQPGDDDHKIRLKYFHAIQDSIQKYPDNLFYKWVRLDLLFNPLFEIQTKPTKKIENFLSKSAHFSLYIQDSIVHSSRPHYMSSALIITKTYNPAKTLGDFLLKNQDVLIADLTKLIENNLKFENRFMNSIGQYNPTANKSNFLYKRGQFYYLTGETEKGLTDFTSALNFFPKDDLTKRIYTSLAAYYYNIEKPVQKENYELALKFISLVEPAIEDNSYNKGAEPQLYRYEREKLELMKRYNDSTSYVSYLQNRSVGFLNYYYSLMEIVNGEDRQDFAMDEAFARSREYELMIYDYLIELNPSTGAEEFKKHKKLIIEKI
ncbi:MAG: hypothetical protein Q8M29_09930 [Bacteroidota bacterium]|nr:hypothetical protein [Bacteroidota bacterium]